jgi:hypothetical protein
MWPSIFLGYNASLYVLSYVSRPRTTPAECSSRLFSPAYIIHPHKRSSCCKFCAELWASRVFPSDLGTSGIAPGKSLPQRYGPGGLLRSLLPSGIPGGIPGGSLPAGFGLGGLGAGGIVSVVWAPAVSLWWFGPAGQIVSDPAIPHPSGTPSSIIGNTPPLLLRCGFGARVLLVFDFGRVFNVWQSGRYRAPYHLPYSCFVRRSVEEKFFDGRGFHVSSLEFSVTSPTSALTK